MEALGHGLVDRYEMSLELVEGARGKGLGRAMICAARTLVASDEPVFAQVSPGNAHYCGHFWPRQKVPRNEC